MLHLNLQNDLVQTYLGKDKETLVKLLLEATLEKRKYKNESEWLDGLADLYRDQDDYESEEYDTLMDELKENFEEEKKAIAKTEARFFRDLVKEFEEIDGGDHKNSAFLVDENGDAYFDTQGEIWMYENLEQATKDSLDNFNGKKIAKNFKDLKPDNQFAIIEQLTESE